MTKRTLDNTIEDLSEELLGDLSPTDRIALMAESQATGDEDRTTWLRETIPTGTYRGTDPAYRSQMLVAASLSQEVTYGLHMSYMEYRLAEEQMQKWLLHSLVLPDVDLDSPSLDETAVQDDLRRLLDRAQQEVETTAAGLSIEFHASRRFAEECLGVDLEAFLALSPPGWLSDVDFGVVVDRLEAEDAVADPVVMAADDGSIEEYTLDEAVELSYDSLVRNWEGGEGKGVDE